MYPSVHSTQYTVQYSTVQYSTVQYSTDGCWLIKKLPHPSLLPVLHGRPAPATSSRPLIHSSNILESHISETGKLQIMGSIAVSYVHRYWAPHTEVPTLITTEVTVGTPWLWWWEWVAMAPVWPRPCGGRGALPLVPGSCCCHCWQENSLTPYSAFPSPQCRPRARVIMSACQHVGTTPRHVTLHLATLRWSKPCY